MKIKINKKEKEKIIKGIKKFSIIFLICAIIYIAYAMGTIQGIAYGISITAEKENNSTIRPDLEVIDLSTFINSFQQGVSHDRAIKRPPGL